MEIQIQICLLLVLLFLIFYYQKKKKKKKKKTNKKKTDKKLIPHLQNMINTSLTLQKLLVIKPPTLHTYTQKKEKKVSQQLTKNSWDV